MNRLRRSALLLVLAAAALVGTALPAQAQFADTASPAARPAISTVTVAAPGNVRVETSCTTTTTVITRVYEYDFFNRPWLVSTTTTSSTQRATGNVEGDTTRFSLGPRWNQYTQTQTITDTRLDATARWTASATRGVTGYQLTAFLGDGSTVPIGTAAASATSYSASYDAEVVDRRARLSMVTQTGYGWTATGGLSGVVSC